MGERGRARARERERERERFLVDDVAYTQIYSDTTTMQNFLLTQISCRGAGSKRAEKDGGAG